MEAETLSTTLALVRRTKEGEVLAREELFARYLPKTRQIVALRLGCRLRELLDVEDLVQESLLEACAQIDRFQEESEASFRNWIARVVENNIRDAERRRSAQKRGANRAVALSDGLEAADLAARGATPSQEAVGREVEECREHALLRLRPRYREALILRDVVGMSAEDMAKALQLQVGTVRVLCHRAQEELRSRMRELLGGTDGRGEAP